MRSKTRGDQLDAFDIASRARASPAASLGSAVACSASRLVRLSAVTCNRPVDVRGSPVMPVAVA